MAPKRTPLGTPTARKKSKANAPASGASQNSPTPAFVAPVSPVPIQPTGEVNSFRRQMEMAAKHWGSMLGTPRHIWKKFDHVGTTSAISSYLAKHDLKKEMDGEKAVITYNVENRPNHELTRFFVDRHHLERTLANGASLDTVPLWSVPNKAMTVEMELRGYTRLKLQPVLEWTNLPESVRIVRSDGEGEGGGAEGGDGSKEAPTQLTVGTRAPDIAGKDSAVKLVRMFEHVVQLKVQEDGVEKMKDFSPLRLWTKLQRDGRFEKNQSTRFSTICKLYVYVREELKVDPATITLPFGKLRDEARKYFKEKGTADGEGDDAAAADDKIDYYSKAVSVYQNLV